MQKTTIVLSTAILATLISTGKVLAQNLPDEINHPQYLRTYQNLEQVLATKTSELSKLSSDKAAIVAAISQMEQDQSQLPARNAQLQQLIATKNQELAKINSDIGALDSILGQVGVDLSNLDAIIAQLSADLNNQNISARQLEDARKNARQAVAQIDVRLQRELRDEDQSVRAVDGLNNTIANSAQKINELDRDRRDLTRDVEAFKRQLPQAKTDLAVKQNQLNDKKVKLKEAQEKIGAIRAELVSTKTNLSQAESELSPLKAKLAALKAEMERLSPEIKRLTQENRDLSAKIKTNKDKITASGIDAARAKVTTISNDMQSLRDQSENAKAALLAAQEAIKADQGQINDLRTKIRELERSGANPAELARLKLEVEAVEKRVAPKRLEIARLNKQVESIAVALAPKEAQLKAAEDEVSRIDNSNASLRTEIASAEAKISANETVIAQQTQANSGVAAQIAEAEAALKPIQAKSDALALEVSNLEKQESTLATTISSFTGDVARLDKEVSEMVARVAQMETTVASAPQELRRIELHQRQLSETVQQKRLELIREQKLLDRIVQDRIQVQREMENAQRNLGNIQANLDQTQSIISVLSQKLQVENQKRSALISYNQDSISKRESLKNAKASAEALVNSSNQEISDNNQDIATIARQLPIKRSELNVISPKVVAAAAAVEDAQVKADSAETAFQARLAQYETQLANAKSLGTQKAQIGTTDGLKMGTADAKAKANKLAAENAAAEAKWEALRRGYVRGEINGFVTGRDIGLSNLSEATRGDAEGKNAGAIRAKNQAEMVLKPAFYLEELDRRIKEDVISKISKSVLAVSAQDYVSLRQSSLGSKSMMAEEIIPALSQMEINRSNGIISALDTMIEQSAVEISNILISRNRISNANAAYSIPSAGENTNTANCSTVYKNVKEFVDACKAEYASKYQDLFESAHRSTFFSQYPAAFKAQLDNVFDSELVRLYPTYLKEATNVGQEVGISTGKMEIYKSNYDRAEMVSYDANLAIEEDRVDGEATAMVNDYINTNGVLTVNSQAKLEATVIPGAAVTLNLDVKNVGQVASSGTSLIRVLQVSPNVILVSREGSLGVVGPRSSIKLAALTATISDSAMPGTTAIIAGEIIHPGHKYRATRVESFRVEKNIAVNPAIETTVEYDASPKVSNLFGTKKHDIDFTVTPKFNGVNSGYTVTLEEVGSNYATILTGTANTPVLSRGAQKKVTFTYKLEKASRAKSVTFRVTVRNGDSVVKAQDYQIIPK